MVKEMVITMLSAVLLFVLVKAANIENDSWLCWMSAWVPCWGLIIYMQYKYSKK